MQPDLNLRGFAVGLPPACRSVRQVLPEPLLRNFPVGSIVTRIFGNNFCY